MIDTEIIFGRVDSYVSCSLRRFPIKWSTFTAVLMRSSTSILSLVIRKLNCSRLKVLLLRFLKDQRLYTTCQADSYARKNRLKGATLDIILVDWSLSRICQEEGAVFTIYVTYRERWRRAFIAHKLPHTHTRIGQSLLYWPLYISIAHFKVNPILKGSIYCSEHKETSELNLETYSRAFTMSIKSKDKSAWGLGIRIEDTIPN